MRPQCLLVLGFRRHHEQTAVEHDRPSFSGKHALWPAAWRIPWGHEHDIAGGIHRHVNSLRRSRLARLRRSSILPGGASKCRHALQWRCRPLVLQPRCGTLRRRAWPLHCLPADQRHGVGHRLGLVALQALFCTAMAERAVSALRIILTNIRLRNIVRVLIALVQSYRCQLVSEMNTDGHGIRDRLLR